MYHACEGEPAFASPMSAPTETEPSEAVLIRPTIGDAGAPLAGRIAVGVPRGVQPADMRGQQIEQRGEHSGRAGGGVAARVVTDQPGAIEPPLALLARTGGKFRELSDQSA